MNSVFDCCWRLIAPVQAPLGILLGGWMCSAIMAFGVATLFEHVFSNGTVSNSDDSRVSQTGQWLFQGVFAAGVMLTALEFLRAVIG